MNNERNKLRIGHVAPIFKPVPTKGYGGIEKMASVLTEGLAERGHDVTLFASGDSQTSAQLDAVSAVSLEGLNEQERYRANDLTALHIAHAYNRQDEFDVFIDHIKYISLAAANQARLPVVSPLHMAIDPYNAQLFQECQNVNYVAISEAQRRDYPEIPIADVIHNGLELDKLPFGEYPSSDGYLLYVGRITPIKGTHTAIKVAKELGMPLVIAAMLDESSRYVMDYYEAEVKPHLDGNQVRYIGEVTEEERNELMANATAMVHPVAWPEPFGLTLIESMACGCPVVAFDQGSIPELVKPGTSGFITQDVDGMIAAVRKIASIDRRKCREYALENFNADKMVDKYENLLYRIVDADIAKK